MTIAELRRQGMLKGERDSAYAKACTALKKHCGGDHSEAVAQALHDLADDRYFKILPLNFDYGYTIEEIADTFGVEVSTISRNKKRLCLEVYDRL